MLPAEGEIEYMAPRFEEGTVDDYMVIPGKVNCWEEHVGAHGAVHHDAGPDVPGRHHGLPGWASMRARPSSCSTRSAPSATATIFSTLPK